MTSEVFRIATSGLDLSILNSGRTNLDKHENILDGDYLYIT
jgi:hypothetical protein